MTRDNQKYQTNKTGRVTGLAILAREKKLHEAGKKCEPSNKKSFILADDDGGDKVFVPKVIKRTHFKPVDHKEILKNPDKMLKYLTIRLYQKSGMD